MTNLNREHLARMSEDHIDLAAESMNLRRAAMLGMVGVLTVALVALAMLFAVWGGPKAVKKIAHQIEVSQ